jgi:hypothetical protein
VSLSTSERARHAIETRWSRTTDPEQRRAATRPARLAAAKAVVDQAPNLTDGQRNRLRVILTQAPSRGGRLQAHLATARPFVPPGQGGLGDLPLPASH